MKLLISHFSNYFWVYESGGTMFKKKKAAIPKWFMQCPWIKAKSLHFNHILMTSFQILGGGIHGQNCENCFAILILIDLTAHEHTDAYCTIALCHCELTGDREYAIRHIQTAQPISFLAPSHGWSWHHQNSNLPFPDGRMNTFSMTQSQKLTDSLIFQICFLW